MKVYHCPVIAKFLHQGKDGFYVNLRVKHVEKECEVQCLSGMEKVKKKIPLIGKHVHATHSLR